MLPHVRAWRKSAAHLPTTIKTWPEFEEYVRLLKKDDEFSTVVMDTADEAYEMCFDFMCKEMGIEHPHDENDFGKSWKRIKKRFGSGVTDLLNTGKGVIFTSHAREEETKTRAGRKFDRMQPTLAGQAREILESVVDNWFYYGYAKDKRALTLRGDEHISAGTRLEDSYLYTDGTAIRRLTVEGSAEYAYERLMAAFNNEIERKKKGK